MSATLTPDRLHALVGEAYRLCGYDLVTSVFGDVCIAGATERQLLVSNEIERLVLEELGVIEKDESPVHLVDRKKRATLCGIVNTVPSPGDIRKGWPEGLRAVGTTPKWFSARATCPACRTKAGL